jgi:hypothetical protein
MEEERKGVGKREEGKERKEKKREVEKRRRGEERLLNTVASFGATREADAPIGLLVNKSTAEEDEQNEEEEKKEKKKKRRRRGEENTRSEGTGEVRVRTRGR